MKFVMMLLMSAGLLGCAAVATNEATKAENREVAAVGDREEQTLNCANQWMVARGKASNYSDIDIRKTMNELWIGGLNLDEMVRTMKTCLAAKGYRSGPGPTRDTLVAKRAEISEMPYVNFLSWFIGEARIRER